MNEESVYCDVCGNDPVDCICAMCSCGVQGDYECYQKHDLHISSELLDFLYVERPFSKQSKTVLKALQFALGKFTGSKEEMKARNVNRGIRDELAGSF